MFDYEEISEDETRQYAKVKRINFIGFWGNL